MWPFKKKEDDLVPKEILPKDRLGLSAQSKELGLQSPEFPRPVTPPPPVAADVPHTEPGMQREFDLINSKLDTIKAVLSSLDQRVAALEKIARGEQGPREYVKY